MLLSGFMVNVKSPKDLEMKGSYQLCKQKSSQRVSGSIKMHAYLHTPEISHITDIVRSLYGSGGSYDQNNNQMAIDSYRRADNDSDLELSVSSL